MKIVKKIRVTDIEPNDWSLSRNGGDYEFGHTVVTLENGFQFCWNWCSSDFGFCQISGNHSSETQFFPIFYGEEPIINDDGSILELEIAKPKWYWQVEDGEEIYYNIKTDSLECRKVEP